MTDVNDEKLDDKIEELDDDFSSETLEYLKYKDSFFNENIGKSNSKKPLLYLVIGASIIAAILILYSVYKMFNPDQLTSKLQLTNSERSDISVINDKVFYIENNQLYARQKEKVLFQIPVLEKSRIFSNENLFLLESKDVIKLNPVNGKEIAKVTLDFPGHEIKSYNDGIAVLADGWIYTLDKKLENLKSYEIEGQAVSFSTNGELKNALSLFKAGEDIGSNFEIFKDGEAIYKLETTEELLVFNDFVYDDVHVLATNAYIYIFDSDRLIDKFPVYNLSAIATNNEGKYAYVDGDVLFIKALSGDLEGLERKVNFKVEKLVMHSSRTFALAEGSIYDVIGMKKLFDGVVDIFVENDKVYAVFNDGIILIK